MQLKTPRYAGRSNLPVISAAVVACGLVGLVAGKMLAGKPSPDSVPPVAQTPTPTTAAPLAALTPTVPAPPAPPTPRSVSTSRAPAQELPGRVQRVRYGTSQQGRALDAFVLGNGPDVTMIFGAFHGNEPITDDLVNKLRDYLEDKPAVLKGRCVVLVPVVNPDGLHRRTRANARGVDLNRNFPGTWRKQPTKARYNPGPRPESESETRAVIKLMRDYKPTKVVSIHQPFHTLNYTGEPGHGLALAMQKCNHYPITPDIGYPTPGSFGDYCGAMPDVAIVTCELPDQSIEAAWKANREALLAAIKH